MSGQSPEVLTALPAAPWTMVVPHDGKLVMAEAIADLRRAGVSLANVPPGEGHHPSASALATGHDLRDEPVLLVPIRSSTGEALAIILCKDLPAVAVGDDDVDQEES